MPLSSTLTSTVAPSTVIDDGVRFAKGIISTLCTALELLPAASEIDHVIAYIPDLNGPVALGVGDRAPSLLSTAEASPKATSVMRPVAAILISAGIVSSGGSSSLLGSVPPAYSSRLLMPSPSASPEASEASSGSKPLAVS